MAKSTLTAKRKLAELLLGANLSDYVSRRRTAGASWRDVSIDLREDIDLDIHPETLRLWFAVEPTKRAS